jgi:glycosyltransferase involved in cell wall biosynthesis
MKILQLIDTLSIGGAERMAVNISNFLSDKGIEVNLCATRSGGDMEQFLKIEVNKLILYKKNSLDFVAFLKLLKFVKREKISHIHAHSNSLFWGVCLRIFQPNLKVIWHDHYGNRNKDRLNFLYILLSPLVYRVVCVSHEIHLWASENLLISEKKILILKNFPYLIVDENISNYQNIIPHLVCLANLRPEKDHITLIHAIRRIAQIKKVRVTFAGDFLVNQYYEDILYFINKYQLQDTITILGSVSNVSKLLETADVGMLCSTFEALPVSLLEYGLMGLPVVVTNVGDCPAVVGNGKFGKLVPPKSYEKFALAIMDILENPIESKKMGEDFKIHVLNNYGPEKFYKDYINSINVI